MKRIISLILALIMVIGLLPEIPVSIFAVDNDHEVAAGDPNNITSRWPECNTDLTHIICYGQSFSVGADAPYYADETVDGVYVYGSITNSANGTKLEPLSESAGNQHPIISAGNVLAKLLAEAGCDTDIILGSYGSGGRTIAQLMSSQRQSQIKEEEGYSYDILSSGRYEVFQNSVSALARYAQNSGQSISCPAIVYLQGETDQNTDAQLGYPENLVRAGYGAGGDREKYKEYMSRLKEDMQREVMEQYGQNEKPLFIIYQVSGTYTRTQYSSINMAQMEFAQENDDVILVQTPYFAAHYTRSHHLTQNGYRWLGEYIGRAIYTALVEHKKSWPIIPEDIAFVDANTVRITVSGAQNGLTIDTWTVENASNSKNLYGFYLQVEGQNIVPSEIAIFGNTIELTLPSALKAETAYLYYAGKNASGTGNIRDNSVEQGFYEYLDDSNDTGTGNNQGVSHSSLDEDGNSIVGRKYPMYNWLASFCYKIEVPEAAQRQPSNYHWEMRDTGLVSVTDGDAILNDLTLLQGSVVEGVLTKAQYTMEHPIVLEHDRPWVIEWKAAGNGNSYPGGKFLVSSSANTSGAQYLYLPADSRGMVAWGVSGDSANYGFQLKNLGIDVRAEHTYRIENRISNDGTNTVYLLVDGEEIGPMTTGYRTSSNASGSAGSVIEEPKNWANGKDIYLNGLGEGSSFLLNNMKLSYLKVWENGVPHSHIYKNGICTVCGEAHPNLVNFQGKVISIMGDSISTFAGYIPTADGFNLEHLPRYPQDNLLTDVNETWWMQVVTGMGAKLGINDSWRGSTLSGGHPVTTGTTGEKAAMSNLVRIQNLASNGTPDVILLYGGTNDLAHVAEVGSFDPAIAPTVVDLNTSKWDNLAEGFLHTLLRLRHYYPNATILVMLPTYTASYYTDEKLAQGNAVMAAICQHYGVPYVDLRDSGVTEDLLPDGIHPGEEGMDLITEAVIHTLLTQCEMEPGEHVVYAVTHELTAAQSTMGHIKGVSRGNSFVARVAGEALEVCVTMGGVNITEDAYDDGMINIENVTGDLVICAHGQMKSIYGDHLQDLPAVLCPGVNLWTALAHDSQYYTANGWGVHSSGNVYSVTFLIGDGEKIWATSFQKAGMNGSTMNGIRLTWFDETDVLDSMSADRVYAEFTANGCLTAPEGAVAVNVVMWTEDISNELYILSKEHNYAASVTAPTCTEQGYTTYTCTTCGDSYVADYVDACGYDWMLEDGEFKILLIGNSFSEDASNAGMPNSQMLDILQAMLGENVKVTVGLCYSGGKGLNWHATQSEQGNRSYSLRVISSESGKWKSYGSYTSADALTWTDWDVVSLQHYEINTTTGKESNAYPDQVDPKFDNLKSATEFMLDYVDQYAPDAAVYFYMHWARAYKSNLNESIATYNKMAAFFPEVLDYAGTNSANRFETIIPVGLAVQNARTTYLATLAYNTTAYADKNLNLYTDAQIGLQRDGGHLSYNVGRYIAALTFAEIIIPHKLRAEGYTLPDIRITESVGKLPKEYSIIAQKAVHAAVESWSNGSLDVTNIEGYTQDPTVEATKILQSMHLSLRCGDAASMEQQITNVVLSGLPADFVVDKVVVTTEAATVTIRYGYISKSVVMAYVLVNHTYQNGICVGCGAMLGDLNLDGLVNSDDLTSLARHVGHIELLTDPTALANADVNGDGSINSDDLTLHARYVGRIIDAWPEAL